PPPGLSLTLALTRPALAQEVQTENMTVVEGGVAEINCRLHRYDGSIVVIQNPARQTLFFNGTRGEGKLGGGSVHVCVVGLLGCWDARPLGSLYSRPRLVPADSPTARIQPSQAVLREGDTLLLTCVVNGNPLPTEITWSRANDSLPERAQIEGAELTLPALSPGDNGTYACHAANKHGRASDQYVLVVYGKEPRRPPTDLQPPCALSRLRLDAPHPVPSLSDRSLGGALGLPALWQLVPHWPGANLNPVCLDPGAIVRPTSLPTIVGGSSLSGRFSVICVP
ncbi:cell adhesion molecule 4-like, partial [Chelonoidis abingdonii]|uniref:cell adhesion molecule 4-like n=1 Tax=Chelonoidis abingdonii TaxID=106734 RepID=UPI003F4955B1